MSLDRVASRYVHQQGFGLPMALFVITVLAVIISSMASLQNNAASSSALQVQAHRALFSAESGIEASLNLLIPPDGSLGRACSTSPFYDQTFPSIPRGLQGCRVSVDCSVITVNSEDYFTLKSTGRCGAKLDLSTRTLEVRVK
jgi:MSHA biogenesis protein MshP